MATKIAADDDEGYVELPLVKRQYVKKTIRPVRVPIKPLLREIAVAQAKGDVALVAKLRKQLPVRTMRSRAQTPLNGLPRTNQKNKRKLRMHRQTDDPYPLTEMNHVTKHSTNRTIQIADLRSNWACAKFIAKRFPGASVGIYDPRCVVTVYKKGEVGIAGAKSEYDAIIAGHLFDYHRAKRENDELRFANFDTANITGSFNFGEPIDMEAMFKRLHTMDGLVPTYEPAVIGSMQIKKSAILTEDEMKKWIQKRDRVLRTKGKRLPAPTQPGMFNLFAWGRGCTVGARNRDEMQSMFDAVEQLRVFNKEHKEEAAKALAAATAAIEFAAATVN